MRINRVFQFLRGAVRSVYGEENFRNKTFLIIGMSRNGQELLNRLCIDGVSIKFQDPKISNYHRSFAICRNVDIYEGENTDIIVNFSNQSLNIKGKSFPLDRIGDNPYIQGIHEYYL